MSFFRTILSYIKHPATFLLPFFMVLASHSFANQARVDSLNSLDPDFIFSNIATSIELFRNLVSETNASAYEKGEALALQNLATALALNGQFDDSIEAHLKAIRLLEKNNMQKELAQGYGDFGYRMKIHNLELGKQYMRRGIAIAEKNNFRKKLCALYDNFGVLQEMDDQPDSAAFYYHKALDLKYALNDSVGLPFSLNNLASLHATRGQFEVADSLLTLSDSYNLQPKNSYGRLVNGVHWGDLHFSQGDLDSAEERYLQSLTMPGAREQNYLMVHCYQQLTRIYEQKNDYHRAYTSQQQFTAYRDSLINVDTNARIAGLEIEFESEKKDRLLAENQLAMEARTRQLIMLGGLAILLAFTGGGIFRYQQFKRRQMQKEMELRNQLRRSEYEQSMADEKLRISRELHDNIGAQLTFLVSSVDNVTLMSEESGIRNKLGSIGDFGRTTLSELRNTVWAMKHGDEGLQALVIKLNELKKQCASAGRKFELEVEGVRDNTTTMSSARMLNLYRITQEAVQNAVKHSEAETVTVRLEVKNSDLLLCISDNGRGFDESKIDRVSGLDNMKHRCSEALGLFAMVSGKNGTRISCTFPVE